MYSSLVSIVVRGLSPKCSYTLRQFELHPLGNSAMIKRLEQIQSGAITATEYDLRFYTHELREFVRYRQLGKASDPDDWDTWNNTHSAILEDYGISEIEQPLYHPDVKIKRPASDN